MGGRPLRVSILGLNYAPEPTGIAPYTTRMASGLSERGHEVRVLTTYPHYPEWRVAPLGPGWAVDEVIGGVPVHRLRHYVPRRPTSGRRALSELSFGAQLVRAAWHMPDVVVAVSPALLSTAIAGLRIARPSSPAFGVVVQDLYSLGIGETENGGGRAAAALERVESWVLRHADGVSVIHDRFKQRVVESLRVCPDRVDVIRNWTHVPPVADFDRESFRRSLGWGDQMIVLHTGAMGDKQGLSNVVEAARLADASNASVRFVLIGHGKQRAELERQAAGVRSIEIRDPLPTDDFVRALRAADLLLVNEKPGVVEMAVPSKLTSYFSAGVAVLAATEPGSTTAEEIAASGGGLRVEPGSPQALLRAAMRLREDHVLRRTLGSHGLAYCEKLLSEEAALDAYDAWVRKLYRRKHGDAQ